MKLSVEANSTRTKKKTRAAGAAEAVEARAAGAAWGAEAAEARAAEAAGGAEAAEARAAGAAAGAEAAEARAAGAGGAVEAAEVRAAGAAGAAEAAEVRATGAARGAEAAGGAEAVEARAAEATECTSLPRLFASRTCRIPRRKPRRNRWFRGFPTSNSERTPALDFCTPHTARHSRSQQDKGCEKSPHRNFPWNTARTLRKACSIRGSTPCYTRASPDGR